jgi:hypothetical protein
VEIKVGIQNVNREIVIESNESAATVEKDLTKALSGGGLFAITDERGRKVLIPSDSIGYVDIGQEGGRHVGFGAV